MIAALPNTFTFPGGNPGGQIVALSYANGFAPETYGRALAPLLPRYHVIASHLRPLWQPAPPFADFRDWHVFGDDLLARLALLDPARPVIGIGHSVGGVATLYAAVKAPERFAALILIEPTMLPRQYLWGIWLLRALGRETRIPLVKQALRRGRQWADLDAAYHYFRGKRLFTRWSDEAVHTYAESMTAPNENGVGLVWPPEWEAQIFKTLPTDVWQQPRKLKVPTLVIQGALTDVFIDSSARLFARSRPDARLVTIQGAGHMVPQEAPVETGQAIMQFLADTGLEP